MNDIKNNPYGKYNGNELDYILDQVKLFFVDTK